MLSYTEQNSFYATFRNFQKLILSNQTSWACSPYMLDTPLKILPDKSQNWRNGKAQLNPENFFIIFSKLVSCHFSLCFIKRYHQNSFLSTLSQHSFSIIPILCTTLSENFMSQLMIFICMDSTILSWQKYKLAKGVRSPQELVPICTSTIG